MKSGSGNLSGVINKETHSSTSWGPDARGVAVTCLRRKGGGPKKKTAHDKTYADKELRNTSGTSHDYNGEERALRSGCQSYGVAMSRDLDRLVKKLVRGAYQ